MEIKEAMNIRHSVREYQDKEIDETIVKALQDRICQINQESGLHIQLCIHEPEAFQGMMAHYGKFRNVKNYIALIGKKDSLLEETCGYYGEQLVLTATQLGLSTCWVAMSYRKRNMRCHIEKNERICCVIALGYGKTAGVPHTSKPIEKLCVVDGSMPVWFHEAMSYVQLAPTAMNQQRFLFTLHGNQVSVKAKKGPYTKVDLGIVRYHFEMGAKGFDWNWVENN